MVRTRRHNANPHYNRPVGDLALLSSKGLLLSVDASNDIGTPPTRASLLHVYITLYAAKQGGGSSLRREIC